MSRVKAALAQNVRYLSLAAAIAVFILMVSGGVVRANGAGAACSGWPTCGGWLPPQSQLALIAYLHRLATLLTAPLILLAAVGASWSEGRNKLIRYPLYAAAALLLVQVLSGRLLVTSQAGSSATAIHLGFSLLLEFLLLAACVAAFYQEYGADQPLRLQFRSPFSRLALVTLAALFVLLVSGVYVAASGTTLACSSWPLCQPGSWLPGDAAGWINMAHRLAVLSSGLLMAALVIQAWRTQRTQTAIIVAATATFVLFTAQALLGSLDVANRFPPYLISLHQATAIAVWSALTVTVAACGCARRSPADERQEVLLSGGRRGMAKDLLMLTKPIVVVLLLVTTFAGMVIGARSMPQFSLVFWTLLAGFMAAGGSGAINQYIDRYDDEKMQRTQKRPIPAGRLTPGEGLAFGVALTLASFYLMVAFVNFLAALLTLAGIIYYVLLYSIFLKKATVQNIVIGGGAGAIPPLVGWAAATGSLNVPSLFLFAIVFMWTPPHFWALALVRRKDYARAGVPMLPVVRGEKNTQRQIFIYTLELVGLTLLLPLVGLGGGIYLLAAGLLGGFLIYSAWKVWRQGGNKLAWKMYRHSSMYLAFLFIALMIDRLIL